jgi:CMP-N-acetylneuraminic acid synthetase
VLDGALFITPVEMVKDDGAFWNQDSALFKIDYPRFFDIDTQADFDTASALYSKEIGN